MTNPPKIAAKYRVYTGLQRVTLPIFEEVKASPLLKTKELFRQIGHFLSLHLNSRKNSDKSWVSFT